MNKVLSISTIAIALLFANYSATAGKKEDKKVEKEWKKKLKKLEWKDYKKLLEEKESMQSDKSSYLAQLDALDAENTNLKNQNSQLKASISQMQEQLDNGGPQVVVERQEVASSGSSDNYSQGVAFKVQIGAFKNLGGAATYANGNDNFGAESQGNVDKYTIGAFRDYKDADTMKKYLRKMGVKDAWVASYKDGQRVSIKQVADYIK